MPRKFETYYQYGENFRDEGNDAGGLFNVKQLAVLADC